MVAAVRSRHLSASFRCGASNAGAVDIGTSSRAGCGVAIFAQVIEFGLSGWHGIDDQFNETRSCGLHYQRRIVIQQALFQIDSRV